MSRLSITKEFSWDMAHMLAEHRGLCKNIHGHTYRMHVEVSRLDNHLISGTGHSDGMVVDFKDLKEIVKKKIVDPLDHAFMYWTNSSDDLEHQIAKLLKDNNRKIVEVGYRPTAEEMAKDFFGVLSCEFKNAGLEIVSIKVWETPTSFAEVR